MPDQKPTYEQLKETADHARATIEALHDSLNEHRRKINELEKEVFKWKAHVLRYDLRDERYGNDVIVSEQRIHSRLFFELPQKDREVLVKETILRHVRDLQRGLFPEPR